MLTKHIMLSTGYWVVIYPLDTIIHLLRIRGHVYLDMDVLKLPGCSDKLLSGFSFCTLFIV